MPINATINGVEQRQPRTKPPPVRRRTLPAAVTTMLPTRRAAAKPDNQLVFPAS